MDATGKSTYRLIDSDEIECMMVENLRDLERCRKMTYATHQGYRFNIASEGDEFIHERLERELQLDYVRTNYPHGTVIKQSQRGWFYRGERKVYQQSIPTLLRKLSHYKSVRDRELRRLVADMRIAEFAMLIGHFEAVRKWDQCDVLYELLAQHYGLETSWLDVTNDFNTALFFATCRLENGKWRPLTKKDIEESAEARYGVIFRARHERVLLRMIAKNPEARSGKDRPLFDEVFPNVPLPIGYQPFLRCTNQMGYGIYMRTPTPLQDDRLFEQLRFEHDVKLSNLVFEAMDGGKAIYPDEGIEAAEWHFDQIANATAFSEEAFDYALRRNHYYRVAEKEKCRRDLSAFVLDGKPITIGEHPVHIGKSRIQQVDMRYRKSEAPKPGVDIPLYWWPSIPSLPWYAPWMLPESREYDGVYDMLPEQPRFREASSYLDAFYPFNMNTMARGELPHFWSDSISMH